MYKSTYVTSFALFEILTGLQDWWVCYVILFVCFQVVAAAILLGRNQDVWHSCWSTGPQTLVHSVQGQSFRALPYAQEGQTCWSSCLLWWYVWNDWKHSASVIYLLSRLYCITYLKFVTQLKLAWYSIFCGIMFRFLIWLVCWFSRVEWISVSRDIKVAWLA